MMDYIYKGELQIFQEDLNNFLNVAQRLKVEGLMTDPNAVKEEAINHLDTKQFRTEKVTSQRAPSHKTEKPNQSVIAKINTANSDNISEVCHQIEENMVRNADNMWECKVCSRCFARKDSLQQHSETHLEGLSYDCSMCEKTFRTRHSLKQHNHKQHRNHKL